MSPDALLFCRLSVAFALVCAAVVSFIMCSDAARGEFKQFDLALNGTVMRHVLADWVRQRLTFVFLKLHMSFF